jgi:chaperonin GroES
MKSSTTPINVLLQTLVFVAVTQAWLMVPFHSASRRSCSVTNAVPSSTTTTTTLDGKEIRGPITAVNNVVIVKVKDTLTATAGGILLPDQSKQRPTEGLVVAAGPGKIHPHTGIRIDNPIQPGMSVLLYVPNHTKKPLPSISGLTTLSMGGVSHRF